VSLSATLILLGFPTHGQDTLKGDAIGVLAVSQGFLDVFFLQGSRTRVLTPNLSLRPLFFQACASCAVCYFLLFSCLRSPVAWDLRSCGGGMPRAPLVFFTVEARGGSDPLPAATGEV